ncbi:ATP-binding protein [Streptomyces sp. NPDC127068]|uniref:ATP-binding protein n=1 Tax=Streptomyces sp. NPDC127068 TaxID=3347127 RepID=UPI003658EB38
MTAGAGAIHSFAVQCASAEQRVRHMRRITRAQLCRWGLTALADSAVLVVSELVTNAILYGGGGSVALRVEHRPDELLIEVTDEGQVVPVPRVAEREDESGRGLLLIACVAEAWGVSDDGGTKWCSLALPQTFQGR